MQIAVWQTKPQHDPDMALATLEATAQEATRQGADLLITPEMYLGGYNLGADRIAALAAQSDRLRPAVAAIARTAGLAIACGMATQTAGRVYNSALLWGADGAELARYDKTHLFGAVDKAQFSPGQTLPPVINLGDWRIGLAICYDIEFPEIARHLARQGADLIAVPTANMEPFDTVPTRLVPARAEENALCIAYANYVGQEREFTYGGLSCLCGGDGNDLVRAGRDPALLLARLSREDLTRQRDISTHVKDRRGDLYDRN